MEGEMSSQDNRDNSSVNGGAVNRRHILLASTTMGVASALGSTPLMQMTRAQAQTAQGKAEIPITEQEAHAIGVDAYLYFLTLGKLLQRLSDAPADRTRSVSGQTRHLCIKSLPR
jgi:ureidoglycolate hydrolase